METQETPKENQKNAPKENTSSKTDHSLAGKILFIVMGLLIAGSVVVTYWRYMVKRDFIVEAQTDCDPTTEKCFIWQCDPNSTVDGEACTGDPETDTWYYKIVRRNAKNIPFCDPNDENCTALVCDPSEQGCSEELCSDENVPEGEQCNDPEQYIIDNPPEEDSEECAPDDQECLDAQDAEDTCAPDDQECLDAQDAGDAEESCAPDDQECLDSQSSEETCAQDDPDCIQSENAEIAPDASQDSTDNGTNSIAP